MSDGTRILVTGSTGLIGRNVVDLLDPGIEVHAAGRRRLDPRAGLTCHSTDFAVAGSMRRLVESIEPDIVVHLAGAVRGDRSLDVVQTTLLTNLVATVELLEAATRLGCRRIVMSGSLLEEPASGGPDAIPPSPYGASRWAATAYARMFHALFATPVVILRPSFAYGPGQESTKLVPYVITEALGGRSPQLSSGERLLDLVYAPDVAAAYLAAMSAPDVEGRTIDVGCGSLVSVRQVVDEIMELLGPAAHAPTFGAVRTRPLEQLVTVNTDAAAELLGWRATTQLHQGLHDTVAWYIEQANRAPS